MASVDLVLPKRRPSTAPGGTTDALPRPPWPRWAKRILLSWVLAAYLPPLVAVPDLRPATSTRWFRAAGTLNGGPREADVRTTAQRCIELRLRSLRAPGPRPTLAHGSDVLVTCVDEALGLQHGKTSSLVRAGAARSAPRVDSTDTSCPAPTSPGFSTPARPASAVSHGTTPAESVTSLHAALWPGESPASFTQNTATGQAPPPVPSTTSTSVPKPATLPTFVERVWMDALMFYSMLSPLTWWATLCATYVMYYLFIGFRDEWRNHFDRTERLRGGGDADCRRPVGHQTASQGRPDSQTSHNWPSPQPNSVEPARLQAAVSGALAPVVRPAATPSVSRSPGNARSHIERYLGPQPATIGHLRAVHSRLAHWIPPRLHAGTEIIVQGQDQNPINGLRGIVRGHSREYPGLWTVTLCSGDTAHLSSSSLTVPRGAPHSEAPPPSTSTPMMASSAPTDHATGCGDKPRASRDDGADDDDLDVGDQVKITAPTSPHRAVVQLDTIDADPVEIDFCHSQAGTDRHLFENICNDCWAANMAAFEPRHIVSDNSWPVARGRTPAASEAKQLGAEAEASYGEQLSPGASVVIIDPAHPYWGYKGTVRHSHRDVVNVLLKFHDPQHPGIAIPDLSVEVRPFGVESLLSFCDMSDDDDVEVAKVDIRQLVAHAWSLHDATLTTGAGVAGTCTPARSTTTPTTSTAPTATPHDRYTTSVTTPVVDSIRDTCSMGSPRGSADNCERYSSACDGGFSPVAAPSPRPSSACVSASA